MGKSFKLKVGPRLFEIVFGGTERIELGRTEFEENRIYIDDKILTSEKYIVLLHELVHIFLAEAGGNTEDERLVLALEFVVGTFIIDNKEFLKKLLADNVIDGGQDDRDRKICRKQRCDKKHYKYKRDGE